MKFSIIIPVYNVYDYIDKCLNSVLEQTYNNYEVIIVNDGTKDNSEEIIKKYTKLDERFKMYKKENGGLSDARNYGVKKATGDYIVFVDGDDYINKKLLEKLNEELKENKVDLVKYQVKKVYDDHEEDSISKTFSNINSVSAFRELSQNDLFVTAWSTAYNRAFYVRNKFMFADKRLHEDFGLIPLVYLCAKKVSSIPYIGYNYVQRENSIMTTNTKKNNTKRNEDMLFHFDNLVSMSSNLDVDYNTLIIFRSFIANAIIFRARDLDGEMLDNYIKEMKKRKLSSYLLDDTFKRRIKKTVFSIAPKLYISKYLK